MTFANSREFPGIAFGYDENEQPFFKAIAKENLRKLRALHHGRKILSAIKRAHPGHRSDFEEGVNVLIKPPLDRQWLVPGTNKMGMVTDQTKVDNFNQGVGQLIPTLSSKTSAQEVNREAARGGNGSVCWLSFSNNEIFTPDGELLPPHVTMGHELIHCIHALRGEMKANPKEEEWCTVGIKGFEADSYTENKIRRDANMPLRTKYFADD